MFPGAGFPGYYGARHRLHPGWPPGHSFGGVFDVLGHIADPLGLFSAHPGQWIANAAKTAGHAIGTAWDSIQDAMGTVGDELAKVPILGPALQTLFMVGWRLANVGTQITVDIAIKGQSIDTSVLSTFKQALKDLKDIAPYAEMVISFIPGIGPFISAALAAAVALAEGQSILQALEAGAIAALPGGPLVKAAVTMGLNVVDDAISGKKLSWESLAEDAVKGVGSYLGIPTAAVAVINGGIHMAAGIVKGEPIDQAVASGAIAMLQVTSSVKTILNGATLTALDLIHGKPFDKAVEAHCNQLAAGLPVGHALRTAIESGIKTKNDPKMKSTPAGAIMAQALHSGVSDTLVNEGSKGLDPKTAGAVRTGVALRVGQYHQQQKVPQIQAATGKVQQTGVELAKAHPVVAAARSLVPGTAVRGFDMGSGLMQYQTGVHAIQTVRSGLTTSEQQGFDLALSTHIGAVAQPKPPGVSAAAAAGYAATYGMRGNSPDQNQALMQMVAANPAAAAGATAAVNEISAKTGGAVPSVNTNGASAAA